MKHTATLTNRLHLADVIGMITEPFKAIGRFTVQIAEADSRMQAVARLNAMTEAELEAKGLTREDEIRRIFSAMYYT